MKYPIANTNYLIEIYGKHIGQAYDIMCKFMKTLHRSSIASKVKDSGLIGVVPAFHGHAHSRSCQVWWHPRYLDGVGLEDFEECERLFSLTNELASGTRMCSAFHRRQQIVEYLNFHDHDKYAAHGTFLFGNYRAALRIISDSGYRLSLLEERLHTSAIDYERYLQEERAYFQGLLKEPLEVSQRFEYLEALERLQKAELESGAARAAYRAFNEAYDHGLSFEGNAGKIKSNYTRTANRLSLIDEEVARIEEVMGIMERWQPNSPEYMACRKELTERQYRRSLDELERLVVQRLMELTKLNMSGVGECKNFGLADVH
ncbi:hypothetical protein FISHEDRAFT_51255 [Fistulina hepatica ATCC 64428]|uniref:Uncharacterized protein n=1 Tax=Fistulina hepatica ATCC 64428 TaxID=1128425 RepID=A0A0D7A1F4_9AGAR|nr:hypothetical protein FISHEDRAFT_51255 [Fistulina hepatica ATCC 64428]